MAKLRELPFRILGEDWWKQELPTEEEMEEGIRNLESMEYKVDYIITHCASNEMQRILKKSRYLYGEDDLTDYLQMIEEKVQYKHWYFGHYHDDIGVDEKHTLLYTQIIPLGEINYGCEEIDY